MGKSLMVVFTIYILKSPVANFTWSPTVPKGGETITFDGSSSTPNGGIITKYEWDFGDSGKATGQVVTHAYSSKGLYTVTLNVTDSEGLGDREQKQIQVIQTYTLSIYSLPAGITFTVDGISHATPWSNVYDEGAMPNLVMPDTYTIGSAKYLWNKWNDVLGASQVGGEWAPIGIVQLVTPWIALVFLAIAFAAAGSHRLLKKRL
jgi:PKD repeat protein